MQTNLLIELKIDFRYISHLLIIFTSNKNKFETFSITKLFEGIIWEILTYSNK